MLLAIDAGNTHTVVGLYRGDELLEPWRLATNAERTSDENPKEVGPDRIANAVGAFDRYGGPVIVVDFGTATTVDATSAQGEYLGGAILPGIEISLDALFARAAALSRIKLAEPRRVIGKSTVESVQSGTFFGFGAAVDGRWRRLPAEPGPCSV